MLPTTAYTKKHTHTHTHTHTQPHTHTHTHTVFNPLTLTLTLTHALDFPHLILMNTLTTALPLPCFVLLHTRHLHLLAPLPTAANHYQATLLKSGNKSPFLASYLDEFFSCVEFANNIVLHGRQLRYRDPHLPPHLAMGIWR